MLRPALTPLTSHKFMLLHCWFYPCRSQNNENMERCPKVWFDTECCENPWSGPNVCTGDRQMGVVLKAYWYWHILIYLTAIRLTPGGSSTVHIYTQTIHRPTQLTTHRTTQLTTNWEKCGLWPVSPSYTLVFALQLRKKHGETSIRLAEECQLLG